MLPDGLDLDTATDVDVLRRVTGRATIDELGTADAPWDVAPMPEYGWVEPRLPLGHWDLAPAALVAQLAEAIAVTGLVLTPRRQPKRMNGQPRGGGRSEVLVNPVDAEAAGIRDGELIEVVSKVGSIRLEATVTESTASARCRSTTAGRRPTSTR